MLHETGGIIHNHCGRIFEESIFMTFIACYLCEPITVRVIRHTKKFYLTCGNFYAVEYMHTVCAFTGWCRYFKGSKVYGIKFGPMCFNKRLPIVGFLTLRCRKNAIALENGINDPGEYIDANYLKSVMDAVCCGVKLIKPVQLKTATNRMCMTYGSMLFLTQDGISIVVSFLKI